MIVQEFVYSTAYPILSYPLYFSSVFLFLFTFCRDYWPSAKLAERNRRRPDATSASTASAVGAGGESPSANETKQAAEEAASAERTMAIMESIKPFSGIFMRSKTSLINYNS